MKSLIVHGLQSILVAALTLASAAPAAAAPGDLAQDFGTAGKVRLDLQPSAVAVGGPEGTIFVLGYRRLGSDYQPALAKLDADGSLDAGFGMAGYAAVGSGASNLGLGDVVVDGDGRSTVVGSDDSGAVVFRLTVDGQPDPSFSGDGRTDDLGPLTLSYAARLTSGSELLVVGETSIDARGAPLSVVRLTEDGFLDAGFGDGGTATAPVGNASGSFGGADLALDSGGRVIFGSRGLARLTPSGQLDPSFARDGVQTWADVPFSSRIRSIVPFADRIITGYYNCEATGPGAGCTPVVRVEDVSGTSLSGEPTSFGVNYVGRDAGSFYAASGGGVPSAPTMGVRLVSADLQVSPEFGFGGFAPVYAGLRRISLVEVVVADSGDPVVLGMLGNSSALVARLTMLDGPDDVDADRFTDNQDRCPFGYATADQGCPQVERALKLTRRPKRILVRVKSKTSACVTGSLVRLLARNASGRLRQVGARTVGGVAPVRFPAVDRTHVVARVNVTDTKLARCLAAKATLDAK